MAVIAVATLASCSKDNTEAPIAPGTLEAKWNQIKTTTKVGTGAPTTVDYTDNETGCDKDYIQFVAGGTVKDVVFNKDAANMCGPVENSNPSSWSKSGTTLTVVGGDLNGTYKIITLTATDLVTESTTAIPGSTTTAVSTIYYKKAI
jgi:hypothetical protein